MLANFFGEDAYSTIYLVSGTSLVCTYLLCHCLLEFNLLVYALICLPIYVSTPKHTHVSIVYDMPYHIPVPDTKDGGAGGYAFYCLLLLTCCYTKKRLVSCLAHT